MLGANFRPWGEISWFFSKVPSIKWDLIGCISTEDRFKGTLEFLKENNFLRNVSFWQINDPPSSDSALVEKKIESNRQIFAGFDRKANEIEQHDLLESQNEVVKSLQGFLENSDGNIVFDITSFPKRFFFPILKILRKRNLKNLIITYSTPLGYCPDELSSNPDSWGHLPLFGPEHHPEPQVEIAVVGVGFMPFGLPQLLLSNYNSTTVKLLFPFPPGSPNYQRTWDFVHEIEQTYEFKSSDEIIRVNSNNMPDAFEKIVQLSDSGKRNVIFAPYGPKPISLAICLFAIKYKSVVYYTQPFHYNPNYSHGISGTIAYSIVLNSKDLY